MIVAVDRISTGHKGRGAFEPDTKVDVCLVFEQVCTLPGNLDATKWRFLLTYFTEVTNFQRLFSTGGEHIRRSVYLYCRSACTGAYTGESLDERAERGPKSISFLRFALMFVFPSLFAECWQVPGNCSIFFRFHAESEGLRESYANGSPAATF